MKKILLLFSCQDLLSLSMLVLHLDFCFIASCYKIPCLLWRRYFRTTYKNWFISTIDNKLDDVDGSLLPIANNNVYFGTYKGC